MDWNFYQDTVPSQFSKLLQFTNLDLHEAFSISPQNIYYEEANREPTFIWNIEDIFRQKKYIINPQENKTKHKTKQKLASPGQKVLEKKLTIQIIELLGGCQ